MAGKRYYELHVTIASPDRNAVKSSVESLGWKFSCIDGDPNLGDGVKMYATTQLKSTLDLEDVVSRLKSASDAISGDVGSAEILRRKVELVLYDDRSSSVKPEISG